MPRNEVVTLGGISRLALLNSKLINFYYLKRFSLGAGFTITVTKENLDVLPIANCNKKDQLKFVKIVDEIINKKKIDSSEINIQMEKIDKLVYELYGLTEEDIKIVQ